MEVIIREKAYEYVSDFNDGWTFSAGDYFKFPVKIGRNNCFIKRFDKSKPENISGWHLLKGLKAHYEPGLPRLHDIVEAPEKGKRIYYVFYEYLEGCTLGKAITDGIAIDLEKLAEDIFLALGSVHRHQFWFADFCEKNIFCTAAGRYFLIDLDSAQPASAAPENEMYADKEYWALAFTYIVHEAGYKNFKPADISGILLNYLQAIFLLLRVKIGLIDGQIDYRSEELFYRLPQLLHEWAPEYKEIFKALLDRVPQIPDETDMLRIKEVLLQKIIGRTKDYSFEQGPVMDRPGLPKPLIRRFETDKEVLKGGGDFRLSWEVENADSIELYRYKVLYRKLEKGSKEITLKEIYDGQEKNVRYSLSVHNGNGHIKSEPVQIKVLEPGRRVVEQGKGEPKPVTDPKIVKENKSEKVNVTKPDVTKPDVTKLDVTKPKVKLPKIPIDFPWKKVLAAIAVLVVAGLLAFRLINSFVAKPALYGFQPKRMNGQGAVTLYGEHFPGNKNVIRVLFDSLPGTITSVSEEKLVVQMPSLGNKNLKASVKLVVGRDTLRAGEALSYEPIAPPVINIDTGEIKHPVKRGKTKKSDEKPVPDHDRQNGVNGKGDANASDIKDAGVNQPPKPEKNKIDLDTADIPPVDNTHAILEAGLMKGPVRISSEQYRITLGVFGRRRRLVFYNGSNSLLNWVKLAIDQDAGGGSEIRILRNVKPGARIVLVDNLDRNSSSKGIVRGVHLEK